MGEDQQAEATAEEQQALDEIAEDRDDGDGYRDEGDERDADQ